MISFKTGAQQLSLEGGVRALVGTLHVGGFLIWRFRWASEGSTSRMNVTWPGYQEEEIAFTKTWK